MRTTTMVAAFTVLALIQAAADDRSGPEPFKGKRAHAAVNDRTLTWKIQNDAVKRVIHFDREAGGLRTIEVWTAGTRVMVPGTSEAEFQVSTADGKTRTVRLDKDWSYSWQTIGVPPHGGRKLTIHLWGIRSNAGYEAEVSYEVYPGNRPYMEKSLTLINRGDEPVTVTAATLDQWALGASHKVRKGDTAVPPPAAFTGGKENGMLVDTAGRQGAFAQVEGGVVAHENGALVQRFKGSAVAAPNGGRVHLPKTFFFTFRGTSAAGSELVGRYHAMHAAMARK